MTGGTDLGHGGEEGAAAKVTVTTNLPNGWVCESSRSSASYTRAEHPCTEGYYAAQLLARERAEEARYAVRAWSRGFAWLAVFGALGATFTALSERNYLAACAGITAVVAVFLPRINTRIVYELVRTEFIRRKLLPMPGGEAPRTHVRPEFSISEDDYLDESAR
jgi:hypothetical protein